jgi:hypothetical protein
LQEYKEEEQEEDYDQNAMQTRLENLDGQPM